MSFEVVLSAEFVAKVERVFGDEGREWLKRLPGLVARCRAQWGLQPGRPAPHLSMNYIEFCRTADGRAAALKIAPPNPELFTEMTALGVYDGRYAVRLLAADRALGAMLLQHIRPGTMLWQLGDNDRETEIAAAMMSRLPRPAPEANDLPTYRGWVERAFRLTRSQWDPQELMPRDLIAAAEAALDEIEANNAVPVLLHGDLHHENILYDEQAGWLAIDPKGVLGPPCLEVGRFVQNYLPGENREAVVHRRLHILHKITGHAPRLLAAAALVDCVLSHCWHFEDEGELEEGWFQGIELARLLAVISNQ